MQVSALLEKLYSSHALHMIYVLVYSYWFSVSVLRIQIDLPKTNLLSTQWFHLIESHYIAINKRYGCAPLCKSKKRRSEVN